MTYQPPQQQTPYYPPTPPAEQMPAASGPVSPPPRRIGAIAGALVAGVVLGVAGTVAVFTRAR